MKRCLSLFSLRLSLILVPLLAGTCFGSDLRSYYLQALKQDPQLQAAYFQKEAAKAVLSEAYARFFPTVSVDMEFIKSYQDIVRSENPVMPPGSISFFSQTFTAPLVQPILHLEYFTQLSQAKIAQDRGTEELEAARQDLVVRLSDSYFGILAARDNIKYIEAEESAVRMHYDFASGRFNRGLVPRTDLEDARAKLTSIQADKVEAEKLLDSATQALQEILGTPVDTVQELKDDIEFQPPDPNWVEPWLAAGKEHNALLKAKRLEAEEARKEIQRQRAAHYPYADFKSQWYRKDSGGTIYGGGSTMDNYDVGVHVVVPIFSGGMINAKVRESTALYEKLLQEVNKQERQVSRQIHEAFFGMRSSITRIYALKKSVQSQSSVLEAKEGGYNSGLYSSVDVLDAAKDLKFYQRNLAKAKYEYIVNYLKLKQATGSLDEDDVNSINLWLR